VHPTPYVAWLRVYEPIFSFQEYANSIWASLEDGESTRVQEQALSLRRVVIPGMSGLGIDGAHVILIDGNKFIAPWSTSQRCWAALQEFRNSLPSSVLPFFLKDSTEETFAIESDSRIPHILTTTWMIPPRWFSLFEPSDRMRGGEGEKAFTLLRTPIEFAKKRLNSAHNIVKSAFGPGPVEEELRGLFHWLNIFDPRSIVECDYGGLATYLDNSLRVQGQDGIESDTSIEDVADSLRGLASGDGALAGEGYSKLVTRWRGVAAYEQAM